MSDRPACSTCRGPITSRGPRAKRCLSCLSGRERLPVCSACGGAITLRGPGAKKCVRCVTDPKPLHAVVWGFR